MVQYRTDDNTRWGAGKGSDLDPDEIDLNFWDIWQAITSLQAIPQSAEISYFEVSGKQFYVHLSDHTTLGPYDLPVATFYDKRVWAPSSSFDALDTFTENGTLYFVNVAHTSDSTFDANATDGLGNSLYIPMVTSPGNALPTGGAVGQVLEKSTTSDYAVTWGWKLPTGGASFQFLGKLSSTNQDATWLTPDAVHITFTPVTGSPLTASDVSGALEELALYGLSDLSDVVFATGDPVSGQFLYYNGASWEAVELSFSQMTDSPSASQLRNGTSTALDTSGAVYLDPSLGDVFTITPTNNVTLNATSAPVGAEITVIVTTSGTSSYNITPTTSFKSTGALATGTVSDKTFSMKFVGDGTNLVEVSRTAAM